MNNDLKFRKLFEIYKNHKTLNIQTKDHYQFMRFLNESHDNGYRSSKGTGAFVITFYDLTSEKIEVLLEFILKVEVGSEILG